MVSFKPLLRTLFERNMKLGDLQDIMTTNTIAKIKKNKSMNLDTIDRIAEYLNCGYNDIVERGNKNAK